jgi:hypothetical protein
MRSYLTDRPRCPPKTNNSSIVSKRSVERLYYPDEPHFFRFFVKKFQRRAPLINRGYHLRLHVIDVALRDFLKQPSDKKKVIVNLGCGRCAPFLSPRDFLFEYAPFLTHRPCLARLTAESVMLYPGSAGLATRSIAAHPRPFSSMLISRNWPEGSVGSSSRPQSSCRSYQTSRPTKMRSIQAHCCGASTITSWAATYAT